MIERRASDCWQKRRAIILRILGDLQRSKPWLDDKKETGPRRHSGLSLKFRIILALNSTKDENVSFAWRLVFIGGMASFSPKFAFITARRLRDAGYCFQALAYFAIAARLSKKRDECAEAIFELGHCAKIAGLYLLAVECFAFVSNAHSRSSPLATKSQLDLAQTIGDLTLSFSLGVAAQGEK